MRKQCLTFVLLFFVSLVCAHEACSRTGEGGKCVSSNCVNGYGKIVWEKGDPEGVCPGISYEGYFRDGKENGYGKLEYPCTGTIHFGQFQNGKENGFGMIKFRDDKGRGYFGQWKDGEPNGIGISLSQNGDIRVGVDNEKGEPQDHGLKLLSNGSLAREDIYDLSPTKDENSLTGVYIPKDLDDCFKELDSMLNPVLIEEIKTGNSEVVGNYHFGLGLWIRNNWGLWKDSRLCKYFQGISVIEPDSMSGIIFEQYQRYLNKQPVNIEKMIPKHK
jgi:hypothetical protein